MPNGAVRRFAAAGAMLLMAGTLVGVSTAPAQAAPTCYVIKDMYFDTGGFIYAEADRFCPDTGQDDPWPVAIERQDPITGTWVQVASGLGWATYQCVGTTTKNYRTGSLVRDARVTAPCG